MFVKAKKILASELMYAKAVDEEEAAEWLEEVLAGNGEQAEEDDEGEGRRDRVARAPRLGHERLGLLVAAGAGERLGEGAAQGVRRAGRAAAARRAAAPSRRVRVGRRDRRRRPARLGGAAILLAEELSRRRWSRRSRAARRGPRASAPRSPRWPRTRSSCSYTTRRRPLVDDDVIGRVLGPLSEGWDGVVPALPIADTVKTVDGDPVTGTLAEATRRGADAAGVRRGQAPRAPSSAIVRGHGLRRTRRGDRRARQVGGR